jgi:hypothetical protein
MTSLCNPLDAKVSRDSSDCMKTTTSENASSGWNKNFSRNASNSRKPSWDKEAYKQQQPTTISRDASTSRDNKQQQPTAISRDASNSRDSKQMQGTTASRVARNIRDRKPIGNNSYQGCQYKQQATQKGTTASRGVSKSDKEAKQSCNVFPQNFTKNCWVISDLKRENHFLSKRYGRLRVYVFRS